MKMKKLHFGNTHLKISKKDLNKQIVRMMQMVINHLKFVFIQHLIQLMS